MCIGKPCYGVFEVKKKKMFEVMVDQGEGVVPSLVLVLNQSRSFLAC